MFDLTWLLHASQECFLSFNLLHQTSVPSHKKKPNYQDPSAVFLYGQGSAVNHDISPPFYSTKSLIKTKQSRNERKYEFFLIRFYIKGIADASSDVRLEPLKISAQYLNLPVIVISLLKNFPLMKTKITSMRQKKFSTDALEVIL